MTSSAPAQPTDLLKTTCRGLLKTCSGLGSQSFTSQQRRSLIVRIFGNQAAEAPANSPTQLNVQNVGSALMEASTIFDKHDTDKSGSLSLGEAVELLNSPEIQSTVLLLTNVTATVWTEEDLQPYFMKADTDRSGELSKSEFLGLYLSLATRRVKTDPTMLAEALLGFIDADRNGKIEGGELKMLLTLLGFPLALILPIPANMGVEYRPLLLALQKHVRKQ